jgi:hypothetical protein
MKDQANIPAGKRELIHEDDNEEIKQTRQNIVTAIDKLKRDIFEIQQDALKNMQDCITQTYFDLIGRHEMPLSSEQERKAISDEINASLKSDRS